MSMDFMYAATLASFINLQDVDSHTVTMTLALHDRYAKKIERNYQPMTHRERLKQVSIQAILEASERFGVDPVTMLAIAQVESALNPRAKARTSSATGLYQFINATWGYMINRYGSTYGIGADDRKNPRANAIMGALLLKENIKAFKRHGINPGLRELYLAHFSGIGKAIKVLKMLKQNPNVHVSAVYSAREIRANRGILKGTLKQSFYRLTNKVVRAKERVNG